MRETIILGAGLAGMATAHYLKTGYELIEKNAHPGGLVTTEKHDGFLFDQTGHWLHLRDKGIKRLVLNLFQNEITHVRRDSRIFSKNVYTFYPFQQNTYGLPVDVIKEIITGYVKAKFTPEKNASKKVKEPATFEEWVLRHMGEGIAKHFMLPYNRKLWLTDPKEMSPLWCQIYVPKPNFDEVLDGALRPPEKNVGYNAGFVYPKTGGIGELSKRLYAKLNASHVHFQRQPKGIHAKRHVIELENGETLGYQSLVSSIPLPELIRLIEDCPPSVKAHAAKLVWNQVRYYNIGVEGKTDPPAHWIYFPEAPFIFYRAGSYSNAVSSMAPKGQTSLYAEISHRGKLPKGASVWKNVEKGLVKSGFVKKRSDILFHDERNIEYAYVVFDGNYEKSVKAIHAWLAGMGIQSIGRYGRWTYNSMETALTDGREAAKAIRAQKKK